VPGLTYTTYKTQIATLAVVEETNAEFLITLPMAIEYAELRMCRDLDFMDTSDAITVPLPQGTRRVVFPEGTWVTTEQMNVIVPAGTGDPDSGVRMPMTPISKEFLDAVYGDPTVQDLPRYYAPFNQNVFLVGPFADLDYTVETIGTTRPTTLSASTPTTFISTYLPDLFIMASMVYISGYQRNFGKQSDDPQMAVSYETQYQTLLKGAAIEEARKVYEAAAWSSKAPAVAASPTRG
jgi:hypothetical protein